MRGILWPRVDGGPAAQVMALAWQLEQTQWWSAERIAEEQARQLAALAAHARDSVPFYAERGVTGVTTREQWIAAGDALLSRKYPADHGGVEVQMTSRTSGKPVKVRATEVTSLFWKALTLRDHGWWRRDLREKLAAIRYTGSNAAAPDGASYRGWGPATEAVAPDAPLAMLSIASSTEEQLAWLQREQPAYLLVYPSAFGAIARMMLARGVRLPSVRQVRTISEGLSEDTRRLCAEAFGVPLVDVYSAQEVGYVAMQCPFDPAKVTYHVAAESVVVEVLREDGSPCGPGESGRVVVTDLHNFAMPVIRYDIGDDAEVAEPCACGRGLPALARVVGRRRQMLRYRDGSTRWPVFTVACREAARYREVQLVQTAVGTLVLRVLPEAGGLEPGAEEALARALHATLGDEFEVAVEVVADIPRGATGKLLEFVGLS